MPSPISLRTGQRVSWYRLLFTFVLPVLFQVLLVSVRSCRGHATNGSLSLRGSIGRKYESPGGISLQVALPAEYEVTTLPINYGNHLRAITMTSDGTLWVSAQDSPNCGLYRITNPSTNPVQSLYMSGHCGSSASQSTTQIDDVFRMTTDNSYIYLSGPTSAQVTKVAIQATPPTQLQIIAGRFRGSLLQNAGANGVGTYATFHDLFGITIGDGAYANNLYISEKEGLTIRKIALSNGAVSLIAGFDDGAGNSGAAVTDGTGSNARFMNPWGLSYYNGNLYVIDNSYSNVRKVQLSNNQVTTLSPTFVGLMGGITFDKALGFMYLSSCNFYFGVQAYDFVNSVVYTAGDLNGSQGTVDGLGTYSKFNCGYDIAVGQGLAYVADTYVPSGSTSYIRQLKFYNPGTPTAGPSAAPSYEPSVTPTTGDSAAPTTFAPSFAPSYEPSAAPSFAPSYSPSDTPTVAPSFAPSEAPTAPTFEPSTDAPTIAPTTLEPTISPTTLLPTITPTTVTVALTGKKGKKGKGVAKPAKKANSPKKVAKAKAGKGKE